MTGVQTCALPISERELEVPVGVTVIHADAIAAHTARTLPELLAQVAGITTRDASGSPDRQIDMRGFGATGDQNTLVLVDGQRLNDIELNTVRWSSIPLDSIERIEISRGNSGAVLYGDGAVGGVVNIVTKSGVGLPASGQVSGGYGSFRQREGNLSASASTGPFSTSVFANAINSDGYRVNNALRQRNAQGDFRYNLGGEIGRAHV